MPENAAESGAASGKSSPELPEAGSERSAKPGANAPRTKGGGGLVRARARALLGSLPKVIRSDQQQPLFIEWTGVSQHSLELAWFPERFPNEGPSLLGKNFTSCNSFTGIFAAKLGTKHKLGVFGAREYLMQQKLAHVWVDAARGRVPGCGDIFIVNRPNPDPTKRFNLLHAGVVLECNGAQWDTVEGGQGGPGLGYDMIMRKSGPFIRGNLSGWVDMEDLFGELPSAAPHERGTHSAEVPTWLLGWWQVAWRNASYFYRFSADGSVKYSKAGVGGPISQSGGILNVTGERTLTITWPATGTVERFERSDVGTMRGWWNEREQIFAAFLRK